MMTIALWDEAALDFFARAAFELSDRFSINVIRSSRRDCRDALVRGSADIALVPTLEVFRDTELFDVIPAVAVSSWDNPFIRLLIHRELGTDIRSVAINPAFPQEALLAKIVLKEHYGANPVFQPTEDVLTSVKQQDASLLVAKTTDMLNLEGLQLDLGRDWFELTHYPMVWGVFAMNKGTATDDAVNLLRTIAQYTEHYGKEWVAEQGVSESLIPFYSEGIRYRLDDLAVAGLTALQDYLYYNEALEEMNPLPMYELSYDNEDDNEGPLL